jgi:hypothetical protein
MKRAAALSRETATRGHVSRPARKSNEEMDITTIIIGSWIAIAIVSSTLQIMSLRRTGPSRNEVIREEEEASVTAKLADRNRDASEGMRTALEPPRSNSS